MNDAIRPNPSVRAITAAHRSMGDVLDHLEAAFAEAVSAGDAGRAEEVVLHYFAVAYAWDHPTVDR